MLAVLAVLTFGMLLTLVAVMAGAETPAPAPAKKSGFRIRTIR